MSKHLVHVDLFAGVGGFTLGFEATGRYRTALMVDSDYSAALTFKRNRPHARYWPRDLSTVGGEELLRAAQLDVGEIDLLTAGPPCQGLSMAGSRQLEDPRNQLLKHTVELICELQPRVGLIENVPALGWDDRSELFDELACALAQEGYSLESGILEAWRFGVPQLRRRLFMVAVRRDSAKRCNSWLPSGDDWGRFTAQELIRAAEEGEPLCPSGLSVEEAIGDLPSIPAGGGKEAMAYDLEPFSEFQRSRRGDARILFNHRSRDHSEATLAKIKLIPEGGRNKELSPERRFRSSEGEYFSQAYARLHRKGIAQTVTTYFHNPGSGRFTHYRDLRALTVREAARFQSFDDDFIFTGKAEQQMRHVGNAVPVLLAARIADHCADLLAGMTADESGYEKKFAQSR